VTRPASTKLAFAFSIAASFAVVALGVASPPDVDAGAKTYLYVGGHTFGIGEQQVYLIDEDSVLQVRYRDANGDLQSHVIHRRVRTSVAWTIEGFASGGGPVLGLSTSVPAPLGSVSVSTLEPLRSAAPATPTVQSSQGSVPSPPPSPMLDSQGAAAPGSALSDLAPASILLSSIRNDLPEIGRPWKSSGILKLSYGTIAVGLENVVTAPTGDQDANVMQIASTGTTDFQAKVKVPGFGFAALRGNGRATATSFLESQNKLLLGMSLSATGHGNAAAHQQRGTYDVSVKILVRLARYVPGIPPYNGSPGFLPASGYLGGTTAPDTGMYSTVTPDKVAIPAATDTGFIPAALASPSPYLSALPAMSLPPIPIPISSDQPMASPPPGPTPTPQPTHY
jgi:hypothetical protein